MGMAVRGRHHVLLDGHVQEQAQGLEGASDPEPGDLVRLHAGDAPSREADVAFIGVVDAGDQVEECRLSSPVGPDHADDLALVDMKIEAGDGHETPERERDVVDLEQPLAHQVISTRRSPSKPFGRTIIKTISRSPRMMYRAGPGFGIIRFSQTKPAR